MSYVAVLGTLTLKANKFLLDVKKDDNGYLQPSELTKELLQLGEVNKFYGSNTCICQGKNGSFRYTKDEGLGVRIEAEGWSNGRGFIPTHIFGLIFRRYLLQIIKKHFSLKDILTKRYDQLKLSCYFTNGERINDPKQVACCYLPTPYFTNFDTKTKDACWNIFNEYCSKYLNLITKQASGEPLNNVTEYLKIHAMLDCLFSYSATKDLYTKIFKNPGTIFNPFASRLYNLLTYIWYASHQNLPQEYNYNALLKKTYPLAFNYAVFVNTIIQNDNNSISFNNLAKLLSDYDYYQIGNFTSYSTDCACERGDAIFVSPYKFSFGGYSFSSAPPTYFISEKLDILLINQINASGKYESDNEGVKENETTITINGLFIVEKDALSDNINTSNIGEVYYYFPDEDTTYIFQGKLTPDKVFEFDYEISPEKIEKNYEYGSNLVFYDVEYNFKPPQLDEGREIHSALSELYKLYLSSYYIYIIENYKDPYSPYLIQDDIYHYDNIIYSEIPRMRNYCFSYMVIPKQVTIPIVENCLFPQPIIVKKGEYSVKGISSLLNTFNFTTLKLNIKARNVSSPNSSPITLYSLNLTLNIKEKMPITVYNIKNYRNIESINKLIEWIYSPKYKPEITFDDIEYIYLGLTPFYSL